MQQLRLPPERSDDPFLFLAAHPSGDALAAATLLGTLCLSVRQAAAGGAAPAGSGGGGSVFGEPAVLELQRHVWSLAFAGAQQGPGGLSAAAPAARAAAAMAGQLRLAALHRHPGSSAMALAEYACSFPQGQPSLELSAFEPLSGDDGDGGFGLPRALAQMPPGAWQAAAWCVQCEGALRLLGRPGNDRLEQEPPEAAFRRYDQYQEWLQPQPGAAAGGGAPAAAAQPAEPAAGGEAGGPEPMAMSSQPSRESLPSAGEGEGSEADEEMSEAAQPAPGAAGAAAAGVAALADAAPPVAAGGGGAAGVLPGGDASQRITCCCWEWQAAAAGGQEQPVLACAFEDGTTQRWQLPSPAGVQALPATGTATLAPTKDGARGQRLAQPARCLASLPGGLLLYGTDCSGLHLLRLAQPEEAPGTAGGAPPGAPAAAAPSAPAAAPAAAAYEPLAPPFLSGSQQGEAGACCALPAAGQVADCLLADLEGCGQRQVYAACRSTTPAGGGGTLCVLYPDPKPETVFELPGAAEVRGEAWWGSH